MRNATLALLLLLAAATARAQVQPWYGTDPGPFVVQYAKAWEVPALLRAMEERCTFPVGIVPLETVSEEVCTPATPPPGGWGCHGTPVVCVDPPPPTCVTHAVTDTVIVYGQRFSPLDVTCLAQRTTPPPPATCDPSTNPACTGVRQ